MGARKKTKSTQVSLARTVAVPLLFTLLGFAVGVIVTLQYAGTLQTMNAVIESPNQFHSHSMGTDEGQKQDLSSQMVATPVSNELVSKEMASPKSTDDTIHDPIQPSSHADKSSTITSKNTTILSVAQLISEQIPKLTSESLCGFNHGLILDLHAPRDPTSKLNKTCLKLEYTRWQQSFEKALNVDLKTMQHYAQTDQISYLLDYCQSLLEYDQVSIAYTLLNRRQRKEYSLSLYRFVNSERSEKSITFRRCGMIYRRFRRLFMIKSLYLTPSIFQSRNPFYLYFSHIMTHFRSIEKLLSNLELTTTKNHSSIMIRKPLHFHVSKAGGTFVCNMAKHIGLKATGPEWNCNLNETYFFCILPGRDKQKKARCSFDDPQWCSCLERISHNVEGKDLGFLASEGPAPRLHITHETNDLLLFPQICSEKFLTSTVFRYPLTYGLSFLDHSFGSSYNRRPFMKVMKKSQNFSGIFEWYYHMFEEKEKGKEKRRDSDSMIIMNKVDDFETIPERGRLGYLSNVWIRWFGIPLEKPGWGVIGKPKADEIRQRWDGLCNAIELMLDLDFILTLDNDIAVLELIPNSNVDSTRQRISKIDDMIAQFTGDVNGHDLFHSYLIKFNQSLIQINNKNNNINNKENNNDDLLSSMNIIIDDQTANELFNSRRNRYNNKNNKDQKYINRKKLIRMSLNTRDRFLNRKYNELDHRLFDWAWMTQISDLLYYKMVH